MDVPVSGFSKKSKQEKIEWLAGACFGDDPKAIDTLKKYWNSDSSLQELHDEFTENVITNYY